MTDNELKQALADNGSFDAARAGALKRKATTSLDKAMKKVLWHSFAYLLLWIVVGLFAFHMMREATDTPSVIGFGILLLVAYESTVLIKLWYWIVNSKLSVLKEIKRMRLDVAALTKASGARPDPDELEEALPFQTTFGRRTLWIYVVALVTIIFFVNGPLWTLARRDAMSLISQGYVTIEADGAASTVTEMTYRHYGPMPRERLTFYSGVPAEIRWIDPIEGELETSTVEEDGQYRHSAPLPRLVMPGDEVNYLRRMSGAATIKDGVWTFSGDWTYGSRNNRFEERVKLPPYAEVVSVEPEPNGSYTGADGAPILGFEAERGSNERFTYRIRYRLPKKI